MPHAFPDPEALIPALDSLPAPWGLIALLLFVTFFAHLVLVNALVGVAVIALLTRLRILPDFVPERRHQAAHGGRPPDLLLPKGVAFAVNFGIPPFLFMQCIYGQYMYASSVQMALWWLSVMLIVMLAYYGFYINMYRAGPGRTAHTTALAIATALLLWNAFLFVNNITLLQNPARWAEYARNASGTLLNLGDPQVVPRYLHVVLSCLAVGGLALATPAALSLGRLAKEGGDPARDLRLLANKRGALRCFFYATLAQIPVGIWFFTALPKAQQSVFMGGDILGTALFSLSLLLTVFCLAEAWREKIWPTLWGALLVIALMTGMRAILRSSLLEPWYAPQMREFEPAPLLVFAAAFVLSAAALFWLAKVYWRQEPAPDEKDFAPQAPEFPDEYARATPEQLSEIIRRHKREALLVIEIAHEGKDKGDNDETAHAGATQKGSES